MHYIPIADTDVGNVKAVNQDSLVIKHGEYENKEILMAVVCDGMGGLSQGEVVSASLIKTFSSWFDEKLPYELQHVDMGVIAGQWELLLKEENVRYQDYGRVRKISLGTTFTGMLFIDDDYLIVHIGDSRIYKINHEVKQLTEDHTFIAREIKKGTMTLEQAKTDKRRNMLLQCVGASEVIEPEVIYGKTEDAVYCMCSDGFRHKITEQELIGQFNPVNMKNKESMKIKLRETINLVMSRGERDNISAILIKAE